MMTPIRLEIRQIVDNAKRAGKPITAQIIWGLLTREVPEDSFNNILSMMCRAEQLIRVPGDRQAKWNPHFYEPGPKPITDKRSVDRFSMIMGNMQHKRLLEARAAARRWAA